MMNPWLSIWTSPRKTLRQILNTNPFRIIIWLAILGGILSMFAWLSFLWVRYPHRVDFRHPLFVSGLLIFGALLGLLNLYFGGWLYRLTGAWIGGKGTFVDVKCAVGWSNYPIIVSGIINFLGTFTAQMPWLYFLISLANFVASFWAFIIFLNLIAEAHRFSVWRAFAAFLISFALVFVVLMLILFLIPLLRPLFSY